VRASVAHLDDSDGNRSLFEVVLLPEDALELAGVAPDIPLGVSRTEQFDLLGKP
jgi:hypothetical protein